MPEIWSDTIVLDYDLWQVTNTILERLKFLVSWDFFNVFKFPISRVTCQECSIGLFGGIPCIALRPLVD